MIDSAPRKSVATRSSAMPGAAALARAIRHRETTAEDAVKACIERIEACDGEVNAVVMRRFDQARAEAAEADARLGAGRQVGPLHGVPITVKDQFDVAGLPTTLGLVARRHLVEPTDAQHVHRLREAGAIILGKTNIPQLTLVPECDNPLFGCTNNPWDLSRTSGGSSGGEAAAVAYGGSSLGLGLDGGGSVRLPAAFCGVCGLKPTGRRLSMVDFRSEILGKQEALDFTPGPIARNVEDLALAMEVLAAPGQQAFDPSLPPVAWADPAAETRHLRGGWFDDNGLFAPSPAMRRAVHEASAILAGQGSELVEIAPPDPHRTYELFLPLAGADQLRPQRAAVRRQAVDPQVSLVLLAARMPSALKRLLAVGMPATGRVRMARLLAIPIPATPYDYFELLYDRARFLLEVMAAWDSDRIDVVLCPAYGLPALTHGSAGELFDALTYTCVANLLGLPAGVVPVTSVRPDEESDRPDSRDPADQLARSIERGSAGLPVAVQVIGRPWREDLVLATMARIEKGAREAGTAPVTPIDPRKRRES
jgi:fatty acid amide hydrolase